MRVVALYVVAALVTGLHTFYSLMGVAIGYPINPLNCVGTVGAITLLGAGVLVALRPRASAKMALAGSVLLWAFYGPLITVMLLMPFSTWFQIHDFISSREYVPLAGILLGPILLTACTVNSALFLFRRHRASAVSQESE
jgi:hypothetical protein